MIRTPAASAAAMLLIAASAAAQAPIDRQALIAKAQVWRPTAVGSMNLRAGPSGPGAFRPDETVRCEYLGDDLGGRSPKFRCRIPPDDEVKAKFGAGNSEVYGEVAATRLLWALGFGADRMYPVRIICRGCPETIGRPGANGERLVDAATIERKAQGRELKAPDGAGWSWAELDLIDERAGGATRAQRDALKLLAVLLQHTDTKPEQQRLLCLDAAADANGPCERTFMMLNDVGLTFGRATLLNSNSMSGMNHGEWSKAPVWKYATTCIGNLPKSLTGTLRDPVISEEGRQFLATLLTRLSDAQLRDLFEAARVERRGDGEANGSERASVQQWVDTFKRKRAEIVNRQCTDQWSSRAPALFRTEPNLWLQSWTSPQLTAGMNLVSLLGYTPFYAALAVLLAFGVNIRAGAALLVLLILTSAISNAAKTVVSYPRPDAVDPRVHLLAPFGQTATLGDESIDLSRHLPGGAQKVLQELVEMTGVMGRDDAYGFPSGHVAAATAFLCGLVFLFGWRRAWTAALIWIPLMALSRMYLGRHFLGDVFGGVAAGLVATVVVVRALNLQRLPRRTDERRVLLKTLALAAACAVCAVAVSIPAPYDAGRLLGAALALACVSSVVAAGYDDASWKLRAGRLAVAVGCFVLVWWATTIAIDAYGREQGRAHAFGIGLVRMAALLPLPVLLESAVRRLQGSAQRGTRNRTHGRRLASPRS